MKLDLPDGHPIAEAIRKATQRSPGHLILSLDHFSREVGWERLLSFHIEGWIISRTTETHFTLQLIDAAEHQRQIETMLKWPEMPK